MIRRPAVTLLEVLIAMFIMAIGMLALLALFPVGAVSMAQALKDDRCASTAAMAENVAIAKDVRHDANVALAVANTNTALGTPNSTLIYVDPYGALAMPQTAPFGTPLGAVTGISAGIPRVYPNFANSIALIDRWFSLPDDITFSDGGTPDMTSGSVDRGRRYSYAYLLRQLTPSSLIQLYVVVYSGRPTNALTSETTDANAMVISTNSVQLSLTGTNVKRGGWILDTSGNFYRVTNITDSAGSAPLVETQQSFPQAAVGTATYPIVIMDYVAEVFDKGTSWQP
jgi:hypothetical protein